ncbi:MAG: hypothetical protein ACR652_20605 [Methylocystis sp.]|uniref:hypothetical protein n=1 Tax=Methylocystis sp. TaxID=1911079 RepID=UPI003DA400D7
MRFSIDIDSGDTISGWLSPDNPSLSPSVIVAVPGRDEVEIPGSVMRRDVADAGYHLTGVCGFLITADRVPDLPTLMDLEILEADTRLPIYRRFAPDRDLLKRLFLFDCSVLPQRRLLDELGRYFSLSYQHAERNGAETTIACIVNPGAQSVVMSGRSHVVRYDDLLRERGFLRCALLREPCEELAERLYFLNYLAQEADREALDHYAHGLRSLIDFARDLPFRDPKGLTAAFRGATETQRRELMSPMTRVFGCEVGEPPRRANVTQALQKLAGFDVIGVRECFPLFRDLLAGALGKNVLGDEEPVRYPAVSALAQTLSRIGVVNDFLAEDLALYAYVTEAIEDGLAPAENALSA